MKKIIIFILLLAGLGLGFYFLSPSRENDFNGNGKTPPVSVAPSFSSPAPPLVFPTPTPRPVFDAPLMPEGVYDFPSLHITSALDPFTQHRNFWHGATLTVSGTSQPFLWDETPVNLRGRGSSTWAHGPEKRPLRLRFNEPQTLLDSPHAARDWVLIANLFDPALIRTHMAFYAGDLLSGLVWSPFSRLVHVYINGDYQGVYQLADERNTEEGRADGDFLFEIDGSAPTRDRRLSEGDIEGVDFIFVNDWVIDVRHPHR